MAADDELRAVHARRARRGRPARGRASAPTAPSRSSMRPWWPVRAHRPRQRRPHGACRLVAVREAAERLRPSLSGLTVFSVRRALRDVRGRAARERCRRRRLRLRRPGRGRLRIGLQLAGARGTPAASMSCRGILRDDAAELRPDLDRDRARASTALPPSSVGSRRAARRAALCYPLPRRGVRVVDGAALEKRCAKAPWVRIPPSPPSPPLGRAGAVTCAERSPSGLGRRTGNAVWGNPSRVQIPPSPPPSRSIRAGPAIIRGPC